MEIVTAKAEQARDSMCMQVVLVETNCLESVNLVYRVSQKKVLAFGGLWNKKYMTDIQN